MVGPLGIPEVIVLSLCCLGPLVVIVAVILTLWTRRRG
jgi:uncharacterized iron-regulated membrane protein